MNLTTITPPSVEPVTLAEVKLYCRIDVADDDALITSLITASRILAEQYTRRSFITQTLEASFDYDELFEYGPYIELLGPCVSITSIKSYDSEDVESTMTSTCYRLSGDRVVLTATGEWPSELRQRDCIVVRYVAGYGLASYVPEGIKLGIMSMIMAAYENRAPVNLDAGRAFLDPYRVFTL